MARLKRTPRIFIWLFAIAFTITLSSGSAHAEERPGDLSDLAERLLPTVVNVSTTQAAPELDIENAPQFPPGSPFEDFFKEFFERHQGSPQQRQNRPSSLGSGFVVDAEQGYIVTNNHVIRDADEIKIILQDDTTLDAEVIGTDEKTDIAVLKVDPKDITGKLASTTWGNSDSARVGSWVLAIGNPFGLGGTVTAGIVSARQRDINAGPYDDFIQTDASINRGNSGGPMFNMDGEVIGVNTAIFSPSGGSVGIGFAVPSNLAKSVSDQLIKFGQTRRGWLGVRIQVVTDEIAESLGLKESQGALVASVTKDGPADEAKIKAGDIILRFNGQKIETMRNLPRIVADTEVDATVDVVIWRDRKERTLRVKLGELEKAEETGLLAEQTSGRGTSTMVKDTEFKDLGISLSAVNSKLIELYSLDDDISGVVVTAVAPEGQAVEKGIVAGDVITEIDQEPVTDIKSVKARITAAEKEDRGSILLLISNNGDLRFVALKVKAQKEGDE